MKKKQLMRALGTLVSCVVAAAMMMSGAVSASADEPDAEPSDHGPQPYVTLTIKAHKGDALDEINGVKLADYTDQERDNNTLNVTTVSHIANVTTVQQYKDPKTGKYTSDKDVGLSYQEVCDASGYGSACSTADPMHWLVNKWTMGHDMDDPRAPYGGNIRKFTDALYRQYGSLSLTASNSNEDSIKGWGIAKGSYVDGDCRDVKFTSDAQGNPMVTMKVPNGIYLVDNGDYTNNAGNNGRVTVPMLVSTVGGNLDTSRTDFLGTKEIDLKGKQDAQIVKTVDKKTYTVGEYASYKLDIMLPVNLRGGGMTSFIVYDDLSKGLSYVPGQLNAKVLIDGKEVPVDGSINPADGSKNSGYAFSAKGYKEENWVPVTDGQGEYPQASLSFDFANCFDVVNDTSGSPLPNGRTLTITYKVKVNSDAGTSDATSNDASLSYSVGCVECGANENSIWATQAKIYTNGILLQQGVMPWSWISKPLSGAVFNIFRESDTTHPMRFVRQSVGSASDPALYCATEGVDANATTSIVLPESGKAKVEGLADGTYVIREISGPYGWAAPEGFNFAITLGHSSQGDGTEDRTQSLDSNKFGMATLADGSDGNVVNVRYIGSLKDVPATSPVGAGVRVLIGVMALMCGIGIFVGMKRLMRRRNAEDSIEA